jgi:hypothetical protein
VRLPFPERVPFVPVIGFAIILCTLQLYQGTAPLFSLGCFVFLILSAITFNLAGGLTQTSGAYVFFYSVLGVIIGITWKAVLGEPADSNLLVPLLTIKVYVCSMCGLLAAVFISRKLVTKRALLENFVTDENMQSATIGCLAVGGLLIIIFSLVPHGEGSVLSALNQLNRFLDLALFLGTIHAIRRSGGRTAFSLPVLIAGGIFFIAGVISFSKEGMITPFLAWLVAAASQRFKLSLGQIAGGILIASFIGFYLVPYSQYGRNYRGDTFESNLDSSVSMLMHLGDVRAAFVHQETEADEDMTGGYFTHHQGFFDRLQMIGPDDTLNNFTEQGVVPGLYPVAIFFENLVPHFIWPNKPTWGGGNLYARQMGTIGEEDTSTGISFSPAGEAFHLDRWTGLLLVAPVLWIMLFVIFDSLCGDTRKSPWGLIVVVTYAHYAPEGGIGILVYSLGFLTATILFAAYAATYIMPIIGEFLIGPNKHKRIHFINTARSRPANIRPIDPSEIIAG